MGTRHGLKPRIPVSPQRVAPSPPGRRRPSTGLTLLFIACVFLVVGGGAIFLYVDINGSNAKSLAQGFSSTIHKGLNVPNNIAVLARGRSLSFYVNQHYVTSVNDTTYSSGAIGVFADDQLNPTEVAFNNAEVWIL